MRIASKINAALVAAFACGTLASYGVLETTIQPRFDEIERGQAKLNHDRVIQAFNAFTEKLTTATQDYSFWDETYKFVQGENAADFISSNLEPEFKAVANLGINSLIFMRSDGTVQWGVAYDLETEEPMEGLVEDLAGLARAHRFKSATDAEAIRGLVNTSKGLMLVAMAQALRSDHSGPAMGTVVSAKVLSVDAVKELTGVNFTLDSIQGDAAAADLPAPVLLKTQAEQIETSSVIFDAFGVPLVHLKANSPRDVSRAGSAAIASAMLMMIMAGVAALGVLWAFLRRAVVQRVEALSAHFSTAGSSGKIETAPASASNDEIGELSQSFNGMAEQVNHLRDALAESAYKSGLSEWAAGTLHNVRNGLSPVTAATWQIEQLVDEPWLKNVETAVAQHADPATNESRRQKLNAFLVESAMQLAGSARRTRVCTSKIVGASKAVLDMVSEFERYAHRKSDVETVDLLSLVKSCADHVIDASSTGVEIVVPERTASVQGNRIILQQVVSNILANALDSVYAAAPKKGRIEISFAHPHSQADLVRLSIHDNGEGIDPVRLVEIFQRGVTSRKLHSRGLGLHWCANAVKVLGGSIRAASDGLGRGATFVIELPSININKQEAA